MKKFVLLLLFFSLVLPSTALADGFGVYEWSAAGVAMGENYMFAENDPAVLAYNPSQLTKLRGSYLQLGFTWMDPTMGIDYIDRAGGFHSTSNNYSPAIIPSLFYAQDTKGNNFWWGLAIFPRFGNNIEIGADSLGRHDTIFTKMTGITVQPTIAFKLHPKWSLALGLDLNYAGMRMDKAVQTAYPNIDLGSLKLDGDSFNVGYLASVMYDFNDKTSAALTYRSRIRQSMDADFDFYSSLYPLSTKAHGVVTLPDSLAFGIGHKLNDKTRLEANAIWTNWATYDALNISLDKPLAGKTSSINSIKNWEPSWRFGLGVEHKLSKQWTVLTGYVYDQTPIPDEYVDLTLPTGDRHRWSLGFKYSSDPNTTWACAYTMIWMGSRTVHASSSDPSFSTATSNNGLTHAVSFSVTFKLR